MVLNRPSSTHTAVGEGRSSTMSPLAEDYLRWLAPQIRSNSGRSYGGLLEIMFEKEFIWLAPTANDANRVGDGLDLRVEFCRSQNFAFSEVGAFLDKEAPIPPCSFLEVLIALSRRLEFNAGGSAEDWALQLVANLHLHRIADPVGRRKVERAHEILDTCIFRNYSPDGMGGFFPLRWPEEDQTKVEIWYQMAYYIDELQRKG